jgi:DNA-binding transcriptional MerR regulator
MNSPESEQSDLVQIGVLADKVGLSLRTVRYYEEVGLVEPATRSTGGFRLYTPDQEERLLIIKAMKPLGFSLEEMRDFLQLITDASQVRPAGRQVQSLLKRIDSARSDILDRKAALIQQVEATQLISHTLDRAAQNLA